MGVETEQMYHLFLEKEKQFYLSAYRIPPNSKFNLIVWIHLVLQDKIVNSISNQLFDVVLYAMQSDTKN